MTNAKITPSADLNHLIYIYRVKSYRSTLTGYVSNVDVYVDVYNKEGEFLSSGRTARISCNVDSPKWRTEEDTFGDDSLAMTSGTELASFLRGLSNESLREWLISNNYGDGIDHI